MTRTYSFTRAFKRLTAVGCAGLLVALSGCISLDIVAPSIVSTTPGDGAVGVPLTLAITATFSEAVKPALLNTSSFTVTSAAGSVAGAVAVSGLAATFTPSKTLLPNTTYTVTLTRDIKDFSGNALASAVSWSFTTTTVLPSVAFAQASQTVDEAAGAVTVGVTLNSISPLNVTVPFLVSGTATGALDHDLADGAITIAAGSLTAEVTFNVLEDALDEPNETVILTLTTPTNATLGTPMKHTVTVTDNDAPTVAWAVNGQTVAESPACPCPVTLSALLSSTSATDVTVPYTVSGTASGGADYSAPTPDPLVIPAGALFASIAFAVLDDVQTESSEFVIFTMGVPTNATLGTTVQHSVEVLDDE